MPTFGLLPSQDIEALFASKALRSDHPLDEDQIQPASLDLRLGSVAYRIRASFLPGPDRSVADCLKNVELHKIKLDDGAVLETGCVYLVPLMEHLDLPDDIEAGANPKSSTGRLDIFTRVIGDYARSFDQLPKGYQGPLYLEIAPRTFPILVRSGSRLSQIRFRKGHTILDDQALSALHKKETLIHNTNPHIRDGLYVGVDLQGANSNHIIGYRARSFSSVIDVDKRNSLNIKDYWQAIERPDHGGLILDPDAFYILVSEQAVNIPPDYAAEMVPFDPLVGEFRVHYAGFFDPGFGHASAGGEGARAVLEVRSREVPFILEHGQIVGRLIFETMKHRPQSLYGQITTSNYQGQGLKLSKHFLPQ